MYRDSRRPHPSLLGNLSLALVSYYLEWGPKSFKFFCYIINVNNFLLGCDQRGTSAMPLSPTFVIKLVIPLAISYLKIERTKKSTQFVLGKAFHLQINEVWLRIETGTVRE